MTTVGDRVCAMIPAICLSLLVAGCTPSTSGASHKTKSYDQEPKKIFVISYVGNDFGADFYSAFAKQLEKLLRSCGTDFAMTTVTSLDLDPNAPAQKMRQFGPDAVLSIKYPTNGAGYSDRAGVLSRRYQIELLDVASRSTVWTSTLDLYRGDTNLATITGKTYIGEALATEVVGELKRDAVLRSCPKA